MDTDSRFQNPALKTIHLWSGETFEVLGLAHRHLKIVVRMIPQITKLDLKALEMAIEFFQLE